MHSSRANKVLDSNVHEINVEISECSPKRNCQKKFKDKVDTALAGMSETKASHMQKWLQEKFHLQMG